MNSDIPTTEKSQNFDDLLGGGKNESINSSNSDSLNSDSLNSDSLNSDSLNSDSNENPILNDLTRYIAIAEQSLLLVKDLGSLATSELIRSLEAFKQSVILQLFLLPVAFFLYCSINVSLAYIVHVEFQVLYLTVSVFILTQVLTILSIRWKVKHIKKNIGFEYTSTQMNEVKNAILNAIKQPDRK